MPKNAADFQRAIEPFKHGRKKILTPAGEHALSKALHLKRATLWAEIFGYPPYVDGLSEFVQKWVTDKMPANKKNKDFPAETFARLCVASRAWRDRETKKNRVEYNEARANVAVYMCFADSSNELAAKIIEMIDDQYVFDNKTPRENSLPYSKWKKDIHFHLKATIALKTEFFERNIFLAISLIKKFGWADNVDYSDMIQEAFTGLMKGVERFDYRKGFRFTTYGTWWIRHAISRFVQNNNRVIRLPVHYQDLILRVRNAEADLRHIGEEVTNTSLAKATDLDVNRVRDIRNLNKVVSMDVLNGDIEEPFAVPDDSNIEEQVADSQQWQVLKSFIYQQIDDREKDILKHRYGIDGAEELTLAQIGKKYGLSRERIRQLEARCIQDLRDRLEDIGEESFFGTVYD